VAVCAVGGVRGALRTGILTAALTLAADQITKLWVLFGYELADRGRVQVLPFVDFVMVWNRGVSYGMFQQESTLGRLVLLAVTVAAVVFLSVWMTRESSRFTSFGLGLVLGGAIGNGIDRAVYGAVADFVLLHAGGFEWYVFNIADAAIVVGAALLLYGAFWRGNGSAEAKTSTTRIEG
jgi:signal peptidase II